MDIKIKESIYLLNKGQEYVVRAGTTGVERNKIVFFFDGTRTVAAGFPRDYCLENPELFQVSRTLTDKEVSVRDVLKVIDESSLPSDKHEELYMAIKSL